MKKINMSIIRNLRKKEIRIEKWLLDLVICCLYFKKVENKSYFFFGEE